MTFNEAKVREDYKFSLNGIEQYANMLAHGYLEGFYANGDGDRGAAVMEIGYIDIELNVYSAAQAKANRAEDDMTPVLDYFICVKHADGEWESDTYLEYPISVNWGSKDWAKQLEADMFSALDAYVKEKGYSYDNPN